MANNFPQIACESMASYLSTNVPPKLRLIETADGLPANSIPNPLRYVDALLRESADSPLIFIWDRQMAPNMGGHMSGDANIRNAIAFVDVQVDIHFNNPSVDLNAGEQLMRRYVRAILCAVADDYHIGTLGTAPHHVVEAVWTDSNREVAMTDKNPTRFGRAIGFRVQVQDPPTGTGV